MNHEIKYVPFHTVQLDCPHCHFRIEVAVRPDDFGHEEEARHYKKTLRQTSQRKLVFENSAPYLSMSDNNSSSSGIGFCGLLAIVFITLKLLGKIDWSWWWVLAPLWIPLGIAGIILVIVGIVVLLK